MLLITIIALILLVRYLLSKKEILLESNKGLEKKSKILQEEIEKLNLIVRKTAEREGIAQTVKGLSEEVSLKQKQIKEITEEIQKRLESEESEVLSKRKEVENLKIEINNKINELNKEITEKNERIIFLNNDLIESEKQDFILYSGSYEGDEYDFEESIMYQQELRNIKDKQKILITLDDAIEKDYNYNSKQAKDLTKLVIRGFNGECDLIYATVKYTNLESCEAKIIKSFTAINRLAKTSNFKISDEFLELKLKELLLIQGYKEMKQKEQEEQKLIREEMLQEERARREYEKAIRDAEIEEKRQEKALELARKEYEKIMLSKNEEEREKYAEKIAELEKQLQEAHNSKERAVSQAQLTRAGHVYVISNIGSFGEDVYKIGMTRRLEPLDRVKELGDASVPFPFDVHALIYSEDAPALERTLHKQFNDERLNLVNQRREFFNIKLEKIEEVVKEHHGEFKLTKIAQAEQYRQSLKLREHHIKPIFNEDEEELEEVI
ncbi:MAG: DUF4041 domain-containing protein [Fusobacteriaceae bacterium]